MSHDVESIVVLELAPSSLSVVEEDDDKGVQDADILQLLWG